MLAIRFNRTGKRNHASFRVVLQEHTKAPGKRHVEILGSYDPHKKATILNKERILYWIGQGAQTSPVVTNLLIRESVIERKKIAKKMPRPVAKEVPKTEDAAAPVATDTAVKAEETTPASVVEEPKAAAEEESVSEAVSKEEVRAEEVVPIIETPGVETVKAEEKKEEIVPAA